MLTDTSGREKMYLKKISCERSGIAREEGEQYLIRVGAPNEDVC